MPCHAHPALAQSCFGRRGCIVWVPLYWRQYGLQNFLFFCDLGNFFITAALWLESPLIFSWQASGLLLFQTLFICRS